MTPDVPKQEPPQTPPADRRAPGEGPSPRRDSPRRDPDLPDAPSSIEAPPAREPGTPPLDDEHEGATEEQVGDRTGPGAGYDEDEAGR